MAPPVCLIMGCGGQTIGFTDFGNGGARGEIAIMIIKTNAPDYRPGTIALLGTGSTDADSGLSGFGTTYDTGKITNTFLAPTIPEPGFYGVLAIGLAGLFVAVKYGRKQTA